MPLPDDQEPFIGQGRLTGPSPFQRLLFAAIGLIAGNAALLIYMMYNALRVSVALLIAHMGEPYRQLATWFEMFLLYAMFSIVGWALVGLPIVLAFPARLLVRMPWPLCVLLGAILGPLALLLIFVVIHAWQSQPNSFSLVHTSGLWQFSVLVSTVSFLVYVALLRKRSPNGGQ